MPDFIDKDALIEYLNAINPCKACSAYGEGAIDAIQHTLNYVDAMPTEPKVNRAEIMRLCNEIEDEVTDIAFNSTHYHIRDCCEAIRKYLKEIGKELTGDDSGGTRD